MTVRSENYSEHNGMRHLGEIKWWELSLNTQFSTLLCLHILNNFGHQSVRLHSASALCTCWLASKLSNATTIIFQMGSSRSFPSPHSPFSSLSLILCAPVWQVLLPCAHAQGVKQSVLSVCHLSSVYHHKNCHECLTRATNATNRALSLAYWPSLCAALTVHAQAQYR